MTRFRCPDPVCQMDRARLELMDEELRAVRETLRDLRMLERTASKEASNASGTGMDPEGGPAEFSSEFGVSGSPTPTEVA